MDIKIGTTINKLRKKKGLTQEQLATLLGISAPAISKWENNHSYPDISLLCPLARALDTTVDTLLQYEETISNEEIIEKINHIVETALQNGYEISEQMLLKLLHQYPNSICLKFNACAVLDTFQVVSLFVDKEKKKDWTTRKKQLLEEIIMSKEPAYWQTATLQLSTLMIAEGDLEAAEQRLLELPEHTIDPTSCWSQLYLKKEEPLKALKITQKSLFSLVNQLLTCLGIMLQPKLFPNPEDQIKICNIYHTISTTFGFLDMSDGMLLESYLNMGNIEEACSCMERYIKIITGPAKYPDPLLFTPGLSFQEKLSNSNQQATTPEMRKLLIKSLEEEQQYKILMEHPRFQKAFQLLKESILQ